jgi:hypothetical protein
VKTHHIFVIFYSKKYYFSEKPLVKITDLDKEKPLLWGRG